MVGKSGLRGFTLIELLIAVVVLSLGLLALAGLQINATRSNSEALQRTQATALANDVVDRMRANPERLDTYATTDLGGATISDEPADCTSEMTTEACLTARANRDRWELEQIADRLDALINTRICITHDVANPGNVTVVIAWRGFSEITLSAADYDDLDACGDGAIDDAYRKQLILNTFIDPANPYDPEDSEV